MRATRRSHGRHCSPLALLVVSSNSSAFAFVPPRTASRTKTIPSNFSLLLQSSSSESNNADSFDFSSKLGWDEFYTNRSQIAETSEQIEDTSSSPIFEPYEWHSSVPHSKVFASLPPSSVGGSVLLVGCGTSTMPIDLYELHGGKTQTICFDYSQPCIDQLKLSWGKGRDNMSFVCGDATSLDEIDRSALFGRQYHDNDGDAPSDDAFHAIIDKGLIDALMCGEGWNGNVERLLTGAATLLKPGIGTYLLVSYKLTTSTKEFLIEVGDKIGLHWTFDLEDENNSRVSFSKAVRL